MAETKPGAPSEAKSGAPCPVRLQKYLARAGLASRRGAENLITAGRVTVNGSVVTELGSKVDPQLDEVRIDGRLVQAAPALRYIMLNKPAGYLTTMDDPQGRPTVRELIPVEEMPGLFPVGRLDQDTTGLLLFMTDGELAHRLLHPRRHVPKRYAVLADGRLSAEAVWQLSQGVQLSDGWTQPAQIEIAAVEPKALTARERHRLAADRTFSPWQTVLFCTITEGRKRQVRRMLSAVGHPVASLARVAFGPLQLGDLALGCWRELSAGEVAALQIAVADPAVESVADPLTKPSAGSPGDSL
ncbi:MAG: rRNA pseudouridine synthase [Actinomycetia bacterium]|nr:rRNA pseudouridine synthase [Actinomycetes bacterium]